MTSGSNLYTLLEPSPLTSDPRPLFRPAPAAVSEVTVTNGGKSYALQVSWRPAAGVVDSYLVRLQHGSQSIHTLAVSHTSSSFSSLVPGRLYSVVIVTRSGSLENATAVQIRTRENRFWSRVQNRTCSVWSDTFYPTFCFRAGDSPEPDRCSLGHRQLPQGESFRERNDADGLSTPPGPVSPHSFASRVAFRCTGAMRPETWTVTWF